MLSGRRFGQHFSQIEGILFVHYMQAERNEDGLMAPWLVADALQHESRRPLARILRERPQCTEGRRQGKISEKAFQSSRHEKNLKEVT